ncbi:MAG TPA: HAD hydrolase family protein, partial [Chthonomonadaceae bacterium]|nr:HAD hydrolase family protein [Chthonomonadaceae bacterium]
TVAARLDVAREETMAIGDHFNDLEVLRWAGVGVAMGNALPEVQAAAGWVTASLEEDGVARAIERFIL